MPVDPLDEYDGQYRVRQIRLGTWIGLGIILLALLHIAVDWSMTPWWFALLTTAALAHLVLGLLPWQRIVHHPRVSGYLLLWWLTDLAMLFAFAATDELALPLYMSGAALITLSASALASRDTVYCLGAASIAGYVALSWSQSNTHLTLIVLTVGVAGSVVWYSAGTAANRRKVDNERRVSERRTEALLENASDAVIAVNPNHQVTYASPSVRTVLGYEPGWLTTDRLAAMAHPDQLATLTEWIAGVYQSPPGETARIESRTRRADGTWIHVEIIGVNRLADPSLRSAVLSVRDISARKALEEELTRQAFEDSLTGMPNRALFRDRLEHSIARNQRGGGQVALLLIDLDNFKVVNDSLGHGAGDQLITTTALRLHQQVRPADTLARLGGDEFAIVVEDVTEIEATDLAERLLGAIRRPTRLGNRDVVCTASIGVTIAKAGAGDDRPDCGELLRNADLAMYAAKAAGRDRYALFDPTMYVDILREADERAEVEQALANDEFIVYYQPIVDLPTKRLTGVEALVRWEHPARGLLGPDSFIALAEATGLIVPLGRWVLHQACAQLARWRTEFPAAATLRLSVNLSARQFQHAGLVDDVAGILTATGVDPAQMVLEITESMLMHDTDCTIDTLDRLKALGLRLAIDDFGTGYSSLSYLRRFPVDILKIDRSFVDGIAAENGDATIAEAVVQLGRALRLQTVAEGIETTEQWSTLHNLGCELGQGFLFARPGEPALIATMLDGMNPPADLHQISGAA